MKFHYPYKSKNRNTFRKLRLNQDYSVWVKPGIDLSKEIAKLHKPVIEIGGPTDYGYYFLDGVELNTKPIITNISDNPLPYGKNAKKLAAQVHETIDGRNMPYDDNSVGVFLMAAMSITDDWYVQLSEQERDKVGEQIEKEFDVAQLEMEQVAIGVLSPSEVKFAQRIQIYREVKRVLCDGGLFFSDGGLEEICVLQRMGFELVTFTQEHIRANQGWTGISYEFVMQK